MTQLSKVKQNIHQHKDKSCNLKKKDSRPNRAVWTVFVNCAHWRGSTLAIYKTVLIIFPLNLQTITITLDVVNGGEGATSEMATLWHSTATYSDRHFNAPTARHENKQKILFFISCWSVTNKHANGVTQILEYVPHETLLLLITGFGAMIPRGKNPHYLPPNNNNNNVVYRVLATGTGSPRIAYRQSLWLADMWYANWAVGSEPSGVKNQNGIDVQAISNLAIGFPLFWN